MPKRGKLDEYRRKRHFAVTGEPPPSMPARRRGGPPLFMVHKHDATRLHYDLRLQTKGVLASWAIPKGPSYDPAAKRLAVQTEDHPLEYANFEGRIPEGEYGAGDSIIWDRGTYQTVPPGQLVPQRDKGHLVVQLDGQKLRGRWHLVRTRPRAGKDQWLLFKAKDGLEDPSFDVVAARPESVVSGRRVTRGPVSKTVLRAVHPEPSTLLERVWPPMKATLSSPRDARGDDYLLEVKYDGYRGLAALSGGRLTFLTRNRLDLQSRFPALARTLAQLRVGEAVLDGEVVALDAHGVSRFQLLQSPTAEHRFVAFDLLWLEGEDLRRRPLEERRDLLESLLAHPPSSIQLSQRVDLPLDDALRAARAAGLEGLLAKRKRSPYRPARSRDWLKLKVTSNQEVAIIGFTPITTGTPELGALLVAVHDGRTFRYAGKVGTGFTSKTRRELRALLEPDRVQRPPAPDAPRSKTALWVQPRLAAQVAFTEWTRDGKLRHPSFQGLRPDKRPEECRREAPAPTEGRRAAPSALAARRASPPERSPRAVSVTHGSRLVFPRTRISRADVFAYYRDVARWMLPALADRPLAVELWPKGLSHRSQLRQSPGVDGPEKLLRLVNQGALTFHAWSSRAAHLAEPDWAAFNLQASGRGFEAVVEVALTLRGLLEELGLFCLPKTSGLAGLHILVPLAPGHSHEDARRFTLAIARTLARGLPDRVTLEGAAGRRKGRVYVDVAHNGRGKTLVAPYSLRGVEGAPASAPLRWSELTRWLDPSGFTLRTMRERLERVGDLFAPALATPQRIPHFEADSAKRGP